jgi:hypothetical protein
VVENYKKEELEVLRANKSFLQFNLLDLDLYKKAVEMAKDCSPLIKESTKILLQMVEVCKLFSLVKEVKLALFKQTMFMKQYKRLVYLMYSIQDQNLFSQD